MDTPDRRDRLRASHDADRSQMEMPAVNPYFMPMYQPQYMPPYGMPQPMMHSPVPRQSNGYDEREYASPSRELNKYHQSMPNMPVYSQPMSFMPFQPMMMPGYYPQAHPHFSYSKNYFHPDDRKSRRRNDEDEDDDEYNNPYSRQKMKIKQTKPKTSDQIVQEFKAETLPRLRLRRLVKIQAIWRGWHVRNRVLPKKRVLHRLCDDLAERKIDEFLEDKIIPDIIMEVITMNKYKQDSTLYSHEYRNYIEIIDDLVRNTVFTMAKDIVRESTDSLAHDFLRNKKAEKGQPFLETNPFTAYVNSLISNLVATESEHLARQCIQDLVEEYLLESQFNLLIRNKYVPKLVEEVVNEAVKEFCIESILENKVDSMIEELAPAMYERCHDELVEEAEDKELEKAVENHVKRNVMAVLLENLRAMVDDRFYKEQLADSAIREDKQPNYFDDQDVAFGD